MHSSQSLDHERELFHAIVALHEQGLAQQDALPLLGYSILQIHQAIRTYAALLVDQAHSRMLEKSVGGQRLQLTVLAQGQAVKRVVLALREEDMRNDARMLFAVGFLAVAHHGVEELFGMMADFQDKEHPTAFHLSMRGQLNERFQRFWRGMRWASANFQVWGDPGFIIHPGDLDRPDFSLVPLSQ